MKKNPFQLASSKQKVVLVFKCLAILAGLMLFSNRASAILYTYEGFNYPPGASLDQQSGGEGWDYVYWGQYLGGATDYTVASGSLTNSTGNLQTSGNHIYTTTNGAYAGRFPLLPGYGTNTWYYSVLIRYDAATVTPPAYPYFGFTLFNNPANTSADLHAGLSGFGPYICLETDGNISDGGTIAAARGYSTVTATVGQTYFLVIRVDFDPVNTTNDLFRLYVNPTPGGTEPATPDATLSFSLGIQNGVAFESGNGAQVSMDEIYIGSTYADVTPSNGQVAPPTPPPLSITQSGGSVTLSWPTSAGSTFKLYSSPSLSTPSWTVAGSATTVGSNYQVVLPATGTAQFFRLSNQ